MNRKLLSVFFCVLVSSTLGHEHLRAHDLQRSHHERSLGSHHARSHQQCSYVCPVPNPSPEAIGAPVSLVFIEETKVFALVNITLDLAIVLQIGEPIALLANGKTGVSVVINTDKQTVIHYPAGSNGNLWKSSESDLVEYLQKLGPLTNVNNWKNGKSFKLNAVTKEVKTIVVSIVQYLDIAIALRVKTNPDAVISLVSVLINNLLESSDVLQLLLSSLESSVTVILGGVAKLVNLVVGLKLVGKKLQGGIQAILNADINISLLLGQNSGLTSLLNLLIQVGVHVDLSKVLGNLLQNPEGILGLAVALDGGMYTGIAGITAVIHSVQLYAAKKISLSALIDILIQVQAANGHVKITQELWNNALNWYFVLAQSQATQFNSGSSWSTLNKFFQDIKNEKLVVNGINVSAIITILIKTSGNVSLSNVVNILLNLKPICAVTEIVATLYFRLIYFVISGQGLIYIGQLLPDIKINIDLSSTTSILTQILSSVNVLQIVSYLLRLDIVGAITHLPVLGPILTLLDEVLTSLGSTVGVTVASALKAVGSILDDLKNIILFGLGRGGKAPSSAGIAGSPILGGGSSVSIEATWTSSSLDLTWSSSNGGSSGSSSGSTSNSQGTTASGSSSSRGGSSSSASSPKSQGTTVSASSSSKGGSSSSASSPKSQGTTVSASSSSKGGSSSSASSSKSQGTTVSTSSSAGGSIGGSGSGSGGISIGGGASGTGGSSSGGSGSHSGGISVGGGASGTGGSSSGGSGSHSGGISVGGDGSSSGSGGSSSGGSASHSGGISIGGSAGTQGGSSGSGGSSSGGSASHSGGISVGGSASGNGGSSSGGSASHSGGISVGGSSGGGVKGSGSWSLGSILGGGGGGTGSTSSHRWSLF